MPKSFKEYLGLPTIAIGGLDSYHPTASLGDLPPRGRGSRDSRVTGLQANYSTQAPGTMRPFLTADAKKLQKKNWKEKGFGPYKFKKEELDLQEDRKLTKSDLDAVEKYADKLFGAINLDVEFTKHFLDRVNDARNVKQITQSELIRLFKQSFNKHRNTFKTMRKDIEAVLNDTKTDINMPFVITLDKNNELDLVAKTVMRKKNFATSNKKLTFEDTKRIPRKPGQKAGSDKHSDLYTDEDPKGTIHGLGFTDAETARKSVSKIKNSGRTHAHKIQAAIAMSQRAKVASERAKDPTKKRNLGAAHRVYQSYIDSNKKEK